jgi:Icc-related predicted phosphoesterase
MLVCHISDTHGFHHLLDIDTNVDLIIHTGDCSNSRNNSVNSNEVFTFLEWYSSLKIKNKIYIGGNHDFSIYNKLVSKKDFIDRGIIYLENEHANVCGLKVFGSPVTPSFNNWAWNVARHKTFNYWNMIESDTDIILCHGGCRYILDEAICFETGKPIHVGCKSLLNKVLEVKPKLFLHGHLHPNDNCFNYGHYFNGETIFSNASMLNHHTNGFNKPLYYTI